MAESRFAKWLEEQMRAEGLTSRQALAESLGVARTTVHYWLTGEREPDDLNIGLIAQRFGVSRAKVYELLGRMAPVSDEEYRNWIELLVQLTPEERAEILDYARYKTQRRRGASPSG